MNLTVTPAGTAELDDREPPVVEGAVRLNIVKDDQTLGHILAHREGKANDLAKKMMEHLTSTFWAFRGTVVFTDLDRALAHELLELAKD